MVTPGSQVKIRPHCPNRDLAGQLGVVLYEYHIRGAWWVTFPSLGGLKYPIHESFFTIETPSAGESYQKGNVIYTVHKG